jgi:hypothetical protein
MYGLTKKQVTAIRAAQGDRCVICGEPGPQHLDHDHRTGKIRQLLCQRCNQGLGLFRDDPEFLRAAAEYVRFHTLSQRVLAVCAEIGLGPVRTIWPGRPPVGSARRPEQHGSSVRTTGRSSGSRRRKTAGEADA